MKKVLLYVISLFLLFSLTGCGGSEEPKKEAATKAEQKIITVGTSASYYPWAFQKEDKLQGFEIDVWNEIAKRNNYKLDFKLSKFSGLVGMLDAKQIDTIAHQMSITPERLEKYSFTEPYAYSYYDFAVKNDSQLKTMEDLNGQKVGCWLGGNGEKTLRKLNEDNKLNLDIVTYDGAPIEKEVEMGRVAAAWQGEIKTMSTIKDNNLQLKMMGLRPIYEVNAYPFVKGEAGQKLVDEVSTTIKSMQEDGTLKKLSEKWFGLDTTKKPQ